MGAPSGTYPSSLRLAAGAADRVPVRGDARDRRSHELQRRRERRHQPRLPGARGPRRRDRRGGRRRRSGRRPDRPVPRGRPGFADRRRRHGSAAAGGRRPRRPVPGRRGRQHERRVPDHRHREQPRRVLGDRADPGRVPASADRGLPGADRHRLRCGHVGRRPVLLPHRHHDVLRRQLLRHPHRAVRVQRRPARAGVRRGARVRPPRAEPARRARCRPSRTRRARTPVPCGSS